MYTQVGQLMRAKALGFSVDWVGGVPLYPTYFAMVWVGGFKSGPCAGASLTTHVDLADAIHEAIDNALEEGN